MLDEVVIKGHRPLTQLKNNALVTTIENSVLSKLGTAKDVLAKIPGVIEKDGIFEVFGKGAPLIYINGRIVRDYSELERLNSENIKNIEVITNPGAQYNATVSAVVRIRTKKEQGEGVGINVRSQNQFAHYYTGNQQIDLNYRKNGLDLFALFSTDFGKKRYGNRIETQTFVDTLWTVKSDRNEHINSQDYFGKIGINYQLNENHSIGAHYQNNHLNSKGNSRNVSEVLANDGFYDKWESLGNSKSTNYPNHQSNFYYNGTVNKLEIDFNFDFLRSGSKNNQYQSEQSQNYENRTVTTYSKNRTRLYAEKLILSYPIGKGIFLFGEEFTGTKRSNLFQNQEHLLAGSDNEIKENNIAAFLEYSRQWKKINLKLGLRYEHVKFEYLEIKEIQEDQSKKYDNLFPSLSISLPLGKAYLSLGYMSKTTRPTYGQLDGNIYYTNRYAYSSGNPLLQPTKRHDLSAMFAYKWFNFMAGYKRAKGEILYIVNAYNDDPKITFVTYENYDTMENLTLFASLSPVIRFWQPNLNVGLIKQWFKGEYVGKTKSFDTPIAMAQLYNAFNLPSGIIFRLDGTFQSAGYFQNIKLNTQWKIDTSIYKSFFGGKLDVNLVVNDIFDLYKHKPNLYNRTLLIHQENIMDSRSIQLTLQYKFNSSRSKYKGTGAGQAEKNRF